MGRSVDHLVADCCLGQLSSYLNISILKASPAAALIEMNPLLKQKKKTRKLMKRKRLKRKFYRTWTNINIKKQIHVNDNTLNMEYQQIAVLKF